MNQCLIHAITLVCVFLFWSPCLLLNCSPHGSLDSLANGLFWHLTDIHVDQNYSRTGNPYDLCHESSSAEQEDNGLYGNFLCDSPQLLVNVTIAAMKHIQPQPDFIIWTGDNLPHTHEFDPDWNVVFNAIKNITDLLTAAFPGSPIFPSIGNHDTFPPNVLLPNATEKTIYVDYLEKGGWKKIIPEDAQSTFETGGYYSTLINPILRIISLNTILWYFPNNFTANLADPAYQFQWLEETLNKSVEKGEKVYLIGHVPPGYYNRVYPGRISDPTFHPQYLKQYLYLLKKYTHIIHGQMFGHLHMDMFQLFQCDTGVVLNSALLASSVTPWHSIDKANSSIPVNPAIRLMHYNVIDSSLKDYNQYFFNLTKANGLADESKRSTNMYKLLYTFTEAYDVPDLSTESLVNVYNRLRLNPETFNLFFEYLTAGEKTVTCDDNCATAQLCSISCTSETEYKSCMGNFSKGDFCCQNSFSDKYYSPIWIYIISAVLVIIILYIIIVSTIRRKYTRLQGT